MRNPRACNPVGNSPHTVFNKKGLVAAEGSAMIKIESSWVAAALGLSLHQSSETAPNSVSLERIGCRAYKHVS